MEAEVGGIAALNRRWTAADFLLHGRYCERDVIADALTRLRVETESRLALLVAYRGGTLFHSLLLLSDANESRGKRRQAELLGGTRWRQPPSAPLVRFAAGAIDTRELLSILRKNPPFERIAGTLRGRISVLSNSSPPRSVSAAAPVPASIHVVLVEPNPRRQEQADQRRALDELLVMVNGSAAVVVHGNLNAERNVDAALDRPNGKPRLRFPDRAMEIGEREFAESLLEEALTLTRSRLGNVYMADRDGIHLRLIAEKRNGDPTELIEIEDANTVVSWVYRRRRPMVINNIPDFLRVHPESGVLNVAGQHGEPQRELAVPIVQHVFADGPGRVIGVINVEKLDEQDEDGGYSYRDVSVLRAVAHRIALHRAASMAQQAPAGLAALMKKSVVASEWRELEEGMDPGDSPVPSDALAAREIVAETLERVYDLTHSYSATVRLLSPDSRRLVRFAAHPAERMDDPPLEIGVADRKSVTAWVARTGRVCNLWNVKEAAARRDYPGLEGWEDAGRGTLSELCVPIVVGGRIAGVLNLESRFRNGYYDSHGIAAAVAEQLGLAIQQARRFHEQTVLSMSTATTANVHELGKLVDRLHGLAATAEKTTASELTEIAEGIVESSQSGADLPERPSATLSELLHGAIADLQLDSVFSIYGHAPIDPTYSGADALTLRGALMALIDNANHKSDPDDKGCFIAWRLSKLGGVAYTTLFIGNNVKIAPDEAHLRDLFRRPLRQSSSRVRLGAFTAGALVRSLGGDVFIEHSEVPFFIVGVDLPVASNGATRQNEEA
ncbi:MAG: GAF domain-containing protein [Solirubrobacterales bacterium]